MRINQLQPLHPDRAEHALTYNSHNTYIHTYSHTHSTQDAHSTNIDNTCRYCLVYFEIWQTEHCFYGQKSISKHTEYVILCHNKILLQQQRVVVTADGGLPSIIDPIVLSEHQ